MVCKTKPTIAKLPALVCCWERAQHTRAPKFSVNLEITWVLEKSALRLSGQGLSAELSRKEIPQPQKPRWLLDTSQPPARLICPTLPLCLSHSPHTVALITSNISDT